MRSEFQSRFFVAECPSPHLTEIRVWFAESDLKIGSVSFFEPEVSSGENGEKGFQHPVLCNLPVSDSPGR